MFSKYCQTPDDSVCFNHKKFHVLKKNKTNNFKMLSATNIVTAHKKALQSFMKWTLRKFLKNISDFNAITFDEISDTSLNIWQLQMKS